MSAAKISTTRPDASAPFAPKPPPAVAAQAARAEALQRQNAAPPAPAPTPSATPGGNEPPAPTPAVSLEPPAPPQALQPSAPPAPPAPAPPSAAPVDWEARARAAEGRLAAERKRAADLELLVANRAAVAPTPAPAPAAPQKLVTPQDETDFGVDMLEVMRKVAREEIMPVAMPLQHEVGDIKNKLGAVGHSVNRSSWDRFHDELKAKVPDYEAEGEDPRFLEWLDKVDPYSGQRRADMLDQAVSRHDAQRAVAFFEGFRSELTAIDPQRPPAASPAVSARTVEEADKRPLETFVAPGKATSAAHPAPPNKPYFTRAQITSFYTAKAMGKYRGREAEVAATEQAIFLAEREGRVTP